MATARMIGPNDVSGGFNFKSIGLEEGDPFSDPYGFQFPGLKVDINEAVTDWWNELPNQGIESKASTSVEGGSGTAAPSIFTPIAFDTDIAIITPKRTPFYFYVPKVVHNQTVIPFNRITAKGSASMIAEDGTSPEVDQTTVQKNYNMKYYSIKGRVTWQSLDLAQRYNIIGGTMGGGVGVGGGLGVGSVATTNAKQRKILLANLSINELLEEQLLQGDGTGVNMTGILSQIHTADASYGYATPNKIDNAGTTAFSLDQIPDLCELAYDDGGIIDLFLMDSATYSDIEKLLQDRIYTFPTVDMGYGFETIAFRTRFGNVPIMISPFANLNSKKCIWGLTMGLGNIEDKVFRPRTYLDLARTDASQKYEVYGGEHGVAKDPNKCAYIYDIKA